jgi:DNA-binding SARP family transcriptional activator
MAVNTNHSDLYLQTFGGAVLKDASGRSIELQPKPLALLVLLRLYTPASRRELERFLWQGVPGDTSNSLSQALGPLRRFFSDLPRGKGSFEWPSREQLACDVDVLKRGDSESAARWDAVFAYQGVFLKDFRTEAGEEEFRHWVEQRQDEFEALFRRLWQEVVAEVVAGDQWERLEKLARHAVTLDRFWQPGHAALVRSLASSGNPEGARRYFEGVRRKLEEEDEGYPVEEVLAEAGARIDEWAALAPSLRVLVSGPANDALPAAASTVPDSALPPESSAEDGQEHARHAATKGLGPARTRPRLRRELVAMGGLFTVVAVLFLLTRRVAETAPSPGATMASPALLCKPGEARGALVDQDFKADPMNVVPPEMHFTTVWHLQNVGRCAWPASFRLHRKGAKPLSISDRDVPAQRVVEPGDTILFPSSMVAPADTGVHSESWVLLEENGREVGLVDRKPLAARIRVLAGPPPPCGPADVVADLETRGYPDEWPVRAGERFTYEWTFMNRGGGCAWDGAVALRFVSATPARLSDSTITEVRLEGRVPASQGYTFQIPMRAPLREGLYSELWSLVYGDGRVVPVQGDRTVSLRLDVRENVGAVPIPALCRKGQYAVAWMSTERPADGTVIPPGGRFVRKWTLANKGSCTWDRGLRLVYVRAAGGERTLPQTEIPLTRLVPPRASYTFDVPIQVPWTPGTRYKEYWSVVDPYGDTAQVSLVKAFWADVSVGAPQP